MYTTLSVSAFQKRWAVFVPCKNDKRWNVVVILSGKNLAMQLDLYFFYKYDSSIIWQAQKDGKINVSNSIEPSSDTESNSWFQYNCLHSVASGTLPVTPPYWQDFSTLWFVECWQMLADTTCLYFFVLIRYFQTPDTLFAFWGYCCIGMVAHSATSSTKLSDPEETKPSFRAGIFFNEYVMKISCF